MLISPEQIYGWRGRNLTVSVYNMANIIDFINNHPGCTCRDIYLAIDEKTSTDSEARKKGRQRTATVLNKLVKKGTLHREKSESEPHIRYWVVKNE